MSAFSCRGVGDVVFDKLNYPRKSLEKIADEATRGGHPAQPAWIVFVLAACLCGCKGGAGACLCESAVF